MTHIMVPDGVLPWWLSVGGWLVAIALVGIALWRLRASPMARMVPLVGVMTALMVVIMSLELVPIGFELHLTALTGMVLGPWYGVIAALLFNLLRALMGDGAFTNIGLNTDVIWIEIALGALLWAALRPLARRRPPLAAGIATFVSLLVATVVFLGVIGLSTINPTAIVDTGNVSAETGGFKDSPLSGGLFNVHLLEPHDASGAPEATADADAARVGFTRFAAVLLALAAVGALIEAMLTGAIVAFIARVRPYLIGLRPTAIETADAERGIADLVAAEGATEARRAGAASETTPSEAAATPARARRPSAAA